MNRPIAKQYLPAGTKFLACLWLGLACLAGCNQGEPPPLQLSDLDQGEYRYIYRMVTLERAKAVALVDRPSGDAILDSLALAWGDSARADTFQGLPSDPVRAEQVGKLLVRILNAELDSLQAAPRADRLQVPLPDPRPAEPDPAAEAKTPPTSGR